MNRPRRAVSTPEELAISQDGLDAGFYVDASPQDGLHSHYGHARSTHYVCSSDAKSISSNSTYDHRSVRSEPIHHHSSMGNSVHSGRRGDPHAIYQTRSEAMYSTRSEPTYQTRKEAIYQSRKEAIYQSRREATYQTRQEALYQSRQEALYQSRQEAMMQQQQQQQHQQHQHRSGRHDREAAPIYEVIDQGTQEKRRLSKPELRQFSREPTVIKLSDHAGRDHEDNVDYPINKMEDEDLGQIQITVKEAYNRDTKDLDRQLDRQGRSGIRTSSKNLTQPKRSQSSSSPEWPPPPDPISAAGGGPMSPEGAQQHGVGFDSSTLKRMLRSLPHENGEDNGDSNVNHTNNNNRAEGRQRGEERVSISRQSTAEAVGPLRQPTTDHQIEQPASLPDMSSMNAGSSRTLPAQQKMSNKSQPQPSSHLDLANAPPTDARPPMPNKPQRYVAGEVEYAAIYRSARSRDSYPDSGVSGMTNDSRSVRSGDSGKSSNGKSSKSQTMPSGE